MTGSSALTGPIVVGVVPGQLPVVVEQAAHVALSVGLSLVCAYVDVTVYPVDGTSGGLSAPIDPDGVDEDDQDIPESLRESIRKQLAGLGVDWSVVTLVGEPAHALAREADVIGASMIVVGSRKNRLGSTMKELMGGSIARQLCHRQDRPVLVIPVDPRIPDDDDD
ncbi:universal stress protein [Paenarthrobacter sp. NPDC092416]|uniref:universal stress protein n=1 Tax=Paenarthrobacter sp. NPDC092416 TaxID=3364386 RepID=UPI003825F34D